MKGLRFSYSILVDKVERFCKEFSPDEDFLFAFQAFKKSFGEFCTILTKAFGNIHPRKSHSMIKAGQKNQENWVEFIQSLNSIADRPFKDELFQKTHEIKEAIHQMTDLSVVGTEMMSSRLKNMSSCCEMLDNYIESFFEFESAFQMSEFAEFMGCFLEVVRDFFSSFISRYALTAVDPNSLKLKILTSISYIKVTITALYHFQDDIEDLKDMTMELNAQLSAVYAMLDLPLGISLSYE